MTMSELECALDASLVLVLDCCTLGTATAVGVIASTVAPTPRSAIVLCSASAYDAALSDEEADDAAATSEAATSATKVTVTLRRAAEEETEVPDLMELLLLSHRPMDLAYAASYVVFTVPTKVDTEAGGGNVRA